MRLRFTLVLIPAAVVLAVAVSAAPALAAPRQIASTGATVTPANGATSPDTRARLDELVAAYDPVTGRLDTSRLSPDTAASPEAQGFARQIATTQVVTSAADAAANASGERAWTDGWGTHILLSHAHVGQITSLLAQGATGAGAVTGIIAAVPGVGEVGVPVAGAIALGLIAGSFVLTACDINAKGAQINISLGNTFTCAPR